MGSDKACRGQDHTQNINAAANAVTSHTQSVLLLKMQAARAPS